MNQSTDICDKFLPFPPFTEAFIFERGADGIYTNVPHTVIQHSPSGYEFGYHGSGPADLALNLCEVTLTQLGYVGRRMACWSGECFEAAFVMHQDAKRQFTAPLPCEGGRIEFDVVAQWVQTELEQIMEYAEEVA